MILNFRMPIPVVNRGARRLRMVGTPHFKKPDGDNLEKFMNDCLTGLVWRDDAQLSCVFRTKSYVFDKIGGVDIFVTEIGNDVINYEKIIEIIKAKTSGAYGQT